MSTSYGVKEEIKLKTDIVQLISEYTRVRKAGASYMAVCPFHQEKTGSLHISPDKGMWYCHGCGEGGDAFGFVMRMEGLDFRGAMLQLAKKAGVTVSENDNKEQSERDLLIKINEAAARYFHETLRKSGAAAAARAYVAKRKMSDATVDAFTLGFAPDSWDAILKFLVQKGVTEEQVFRAGLASRSERGPQAGGAANTARYFDRFRNRLMFPIRDHNGHVVGFTARVMPMPDGKDPKDEAKYVNTSQTPIYNKSHVLYGLDAAKKEIKAKNLAVIVEGNMDVIASHQAGVTNVVASSGTAFTGEQMILLKRFTDRLVLSFDNDTAGETAARRSIDVAVAHGFSVRMLRLPPGMKDPDDAVRAGADVWQKAIADAVPYMEWYIGLAKGRTDFRNPDSVRTTSEALLKEVAKLTSPVERSFWVRELSQMFDTPEGVLLEAVGRVRSQESGVRSSATAGANAAEQPKKPAIALKPRLSRHGVASRHLFGVALAWPEFGAMVVAEVSPETLDLDHAPLYSEFATQYNANRSGGATATTFRDFLERQGRIDDAARVASLEHHAAELSGALTHEQRRDELVGLIGELKRLHTSRRQRELKEAMHAAEKSGDEAAIRDIQRQLSELTV